MNSAQLGSFESLAQQVAVDGFAIARHVVPASLIGELRKMCSAAADGPSVSRRGESVYGIRRLLAAVPAIRDVLSANPFIELAACVIGPSARPVMGVYFDKTPDANWPVPWHQDVTFRVRQNLEAPGFEARPVKDGVVHMLPPLELSEQMIALRIHLDDAGAKHGALRVIPGSHRLGRLTNELDQQTNCEAMVCDVRAGDVMLMRPLLVHASSACESPDHRRVIHIEYAAFDLPGGLEWDG